MQIVLSAFQWVAFMVAGSIAAPIAIADLFQLSPADTAGFIQRTIFVLGAASLIQALVGHKLPINEGPAGLWWGVFAIYAGFAGTLYSSHEEVLTVLQGGMIVSGVIFFILSATGLLKKLSSLFTPTITFIYLMLLILQLSGSFIKGMFGIQHEGQSMEPLVLLGSVLTILVALYFSSSKRKWIQQYSIILALAAGWIIFILMGLGETATVSDSWFSFPEVFVFGKPVFDTGVIVTSIFITFLLTTNMIASIRVMEEVMRVNGRPTYERYSRSGFASGINQLFGGIFSAIGSVPISGSAGFVAATGMYSILPFILGSGIIMIISLIPKIMNLFASLPAPVGYAVTTVIFIKMVGLALGEYRKEENVERIHFVAGISLIVGVGAMFVPPSAFKEMPVVVASILNNGLILGTITAIIVEQYLLKKQSNHSITSKH
ncbi:MULTISPECIES: purine/pyrimidine permease [Bacillaceae]|uniref:purine/pyrimidine permease n=1 Tax=Bacillaceae TaxID=186817 RepID=UPI001C56766C|nr:purine/pyrimidine permease [Rossellomorea sp. YZS02]MBW3114530.1 purine/pyrimidine permease [Bacillus sp. MCCB 382]MDX8344351.1 purine/pyrimidine permease [Rossellomorea sp. YZS02]